MSTPEDVSQAGRFIGVVAGLCSLSCVVVSLRIWVRLRLTKQGLGWDDAFMIAAAVSLIATGSSIILLITKQVSRRCSLRSP